MMPYLAFLVTASWTYQLSKTWKGSNVYVPGRGHEMNFVYALPLYEIKKYQHLLELIRVRVCFQDRKLSNTAFPHTNNKPAELEIKDTLLFLKMK